MRFRKLRIAFSALCGLAVALLVLLWVRSFYTAIGFRQQVTSTLAFSLIAQRGFVGAVVFNPINEAPRGYYTWGVSTMDLSRLPKPNLDLRLRRRPDIYVQIMVPLWFVMLTIAVTSIVAWRIEWRFTLRTLLTAMTVLGVSLRLIV